MLKKIIILAAMVCPLIGHPQVTTGFHRVNQVFSRASGSSYVQVQPYATIFVTSTASGSAATIYSDPLLTIAIAGSVVTADANGNYNYYMPLNYCVTEAVSYPGGGTITTPNLCGNTGTVQTPVSIANGGTGATSAASALSNLGGVPLAGGTMTAGKAIC